MLVYIVFSVCILILGKHKKQYTLLFLGVIFYQTLLNYFPEIFTENVYIFVSTVLVFLVGLCVYDWSKWGISVDYMWFVEVIPLIIIKLIEILFIMYPLIFFDERFIHYYLKLDGYFIGGILFVMFCREVGYNPLRYNYKNFRKYILSLLVSYIFFFNYV
tara:strand:+ start:15772 stop:16251 length:480 start_codon:yes stop_codon:yes gene_type:complete